MPIDRDQKSTLERIEELKLILSRDPGSHAYVELAQLYIQAGDLVSARGVVLDGLSRDQRHVPGQMTLAEVDFALGFYDRAEPTLRKILQARPKNSAATLLLVDLLINTERQSEAVTLLRQKIRLYSDPDFVARLQELTGAGSVSLMGLATGGGTQMLRPGAERQARRRPDAARTVNTVAPTPLSETPQVNPEPQTAEGAVPLTLINQLRAQAGAPELENEAPEQAEITERGTSPSTHDSLQLDESTQRKPAAKNTIVDVLTPDPSNHEDRGPVIDGQPTVPFDQADLIAYLHGQVEASPVDDGPASEADPHRYESPPQNPHDGEETRRDFMLAPQSGMPGAAPQSGPPRLPPQPDRPSAIPEPETRNLTPSTRRAEPTSSRDSARPGPEPTPVATPDRFQDVETQPRHELSPRQASARAASADERPTYPRAASSDERPTYQRGRPIESSTSEGDRRPDSDEVETRVLSKVDGEVSSTDNIDARVLEALQEQPLMTKRMLLGALLIVASIFAGVTVRQYQLAVDGSIDRLARLRLSLKDGNFESRVKLLQAYRRQPALSASSELIRTLVNRFSVSAYDTNQADTFALMKRTQAEVRYLFGDKPPAIGTPNEPSEFVSASGAHDSLVANILMSLNDRRLETAKTLLPQLSLNAGLSADSNWVKARVALETGNRVEAIARLRRATRDDPNHPHAGPLLVKLTTSTGQPIPSFAAFRKLLEKDKPGHISSQIAYHAFRIGVGKESAKAKQALRELLGRERRLAKRQRAEIQLALGHQFLNTNHLGAAQDSFKNAIALQPDIFRFAEPLIKLHLAHYELDQARALLELYANLKEPRLHSYWAHFEALRGRASAALAHLAKAPSGDLMTRLLKGQMHLLRAQNLDGFVTPAAAKQHLERAHEVFTALNNESKSMVSLTVSEFKDARIGLAVTETMKSSSKARALRRLEALRDGVGKDWGRQARGRVLVAYGQALTRAGRYKNARRQLNLAQQLIPEDFQVHWALCQLNDKLRRSRAAITQCRKALKNPFYEPARYRLASIAAQYGDDPSVVFALQAMVESSAATDKATRRLIGSLARLERFDQIKKTLARFKTNWSEASVAYANALLAEKAGRMNEAEKLYTQAKDAHPGEVDIVLDYARFMTSRGRRDLSLSALDALASTSSDVRVRLLSAKVAIEVGDFGRARRYAQTAFKQTRNEHAAPESKASALALRGQAMLLSGNKRKHAAARRLIAKARLVDRNHPDVLLGMAFSAESRGQFSKAVASIQKLISLRPTEARGYYHLGRVLSRLLDSEGKAMEGLEKARALEPDGLWGLRASSLLKRIKANARRR